MTSSTEEPSSTTTAELRRNLSAHRTRAPPQSIVTNEIKLEQREFISSVQEGWLFKQGGRIKTWKKRYTILSGNVLYYFKTPKDISPAGFIP